MKVKVHSILGIKKIIGQGDLEVAITQGSTLESLLSEMVQTYGEVLSSYLYGPSGNDLLPHIRLMVNGRDIEFLDGLNTELHNGDEILILPPVSGG